MVAPEQTVTATKPGPRGSIWAGQSLLPSASGGMYQGRVFVEVWDTTTLLGIAGYDPSASNRFIDRVRTELLRTPQTLRNVDPWDGRSTSLTAVGQTYLGRFIAEIWSDRVVFSVTGAGSNVEDRARKRLGM